MAILNQRDLYYSMSHEEEGYNSIAFHYQVKIPKEGEDVWKWRG